MTKYIEDEDGETVHVINEDDPLERKYTPAQPAFTSTGMSISIRGDIFGGLQFEASNIIDDTTDEAQINERIDMMRRFFERQRAVIEHRETKFKLYNAQVMLRELPKIISEYTEKRNHERAREQAKWQSRFVRDGKRGDFRYSAAQSQWIDQFEDETAKKLDEYKRMVEGYPGEIKNLADRLERCQRLIDGEDKTSLLDYELTDEEKQNVMFGQAAE